jgi:hypothetical protein
MFVGVSMFFLKTDLGILGGVCNDISMFGA